jgi:hypothetical protein
MKPQGPACPAATFSPAETLIADLERKIAEKRSKRLATTPDRWKGHFVASWTLKRSGEPLGSPRRAIRAQCLECCGFDVLAITECTAYACALWNFRPFQAKAVLAEGKGVPNEA